MGMPKEEAKPDPLGLVREAAEKLHKSARRKRKAGFIAASVVYLASVLGPLVLPNWENWMNWDNPPFAVATVMLVIMSFVVGAALVEASKSQIGITVIAATKHIGPNSPKVFTLEQLVGLEPKYGKRTSELLDELFKPEPEKYESLD